MKLTRERLEYYKEVRKTWAVPKGPDMIVGELIAHAEATIDQQPIIATCDSIPSRGELASQIMAARYVNTGIGEVIDRSHASMFAAQSVIGADALRAELRKEQAK